jgi:integrase
MAKFHYYLKNALSEGETAIYLSIQSNGRRLKYYTGQSVKPKFWNFLTQRAESKPPIDPPGTEKKFIRNENNSNLTTIQAKESFKTAPEFNTVLNTYQTAAETAANRLKAELKNEPTPEQIRAELDLVFNVTKPQPKTKDFISFFEYVAEQTKIRTNATTGKPLSPTRCKSLKQTIGVIRNFQLQTRYKVDFDSIDRDFYDNFKTHLEKELRLSANTVGKHIKQIKTVLNEATEMGINTNLRYKSKHFRVITEAAINIYLNESELLDLQKLDLSKKLRLAKVRDLFLIGAWTGLRFSDFSRLTRDNIFTDNEGNQNFKIKTLKTDTEVDIPILPPTMAVLNLYGGPDNLSLPDSISNQKMNEYLKEIGEMVDSLNVPFNKDRTTGGMKISTNKMKWQYLSTHTARRSFATNMFERGISVQNIMSITGHKTEQEFYKYIQMSPTNKAKLFRNEFYNTNKPNLKIAQ